MQRLFRETTQAEERLRLLSSLALVRDDSLIHRFLDFLTSDDVRGHEVTEGVSALASGSSVGRQAAWTWLQAKREYLIQRFAGTLLLSRTVSPCIIPLLMPSLIHVAVGESGCARIRDGSKGR